MSTEFEFLAHKRVFPNSKAGNPLIGRIASFIRRASIAFAAGLVFVMPPLVVAADAAIARFYGHSQRSPFIVRIIA